MVEKRKLNEELEQLASILSNLRPKPCEIDRHLVVREHLAIDSDSKLLSMRQRLRFWKLATGVSTVSSMVLVLLLTAIRTDQPTNAKPSFVKSSKEIREGEDEAGLLTIHGIDSKFHTVLNDRDFEASYIELRNRILTEGIEALSPLASTAKQPHSSMDGDLWPIEFHDPRFGG